MDKKSVFENPLLSSKVKSANGKAVRVLFVAQQEAKGLKKSRE